MTARREARSGNDRRCRSRKERIPHRGSGLSRKGRAETACEPLTAHGSDRESPTLPDRDGSMPWVALSSALSGGTGSRCAIDSSSIRPAVREDEQERLPGCRSNRGSSRSGYDAFRASQNRRSARSAGIASSPSSACQSSNGRGEPNSGFPSRAGSSATTGKNCSPRRAPAIVGVRDRVDLCMLAATCGTPPARMGAARGVGRFGNSRDRFCRCLGPSVSAADGCSRCRSHLRIGHSCVDRKRRSLL